MTKNNQLTVRDFINLIVTYGDDYTGWEVNDYTDTTDYDWCINNASSFVRINQFLDKRGDRIVTHITIRGDAYPDRCIIADVHPEEK